LKTIQAIIALMAGASADEVVIEQTAAATERKGLLKRFRSNWI
jgi:hypothetical protein